jgi:hypothetical protein
VIRDTRSDLFLPSHVELSGSLSVLARASVAPSAPCLYSFQAIAITISRWYANYDLCRSHESACERETVLHR